MKNGHGPPSSHGPPKPSTTDRMSCAVTALVGVLRVGWTWPKDFGSTPARPMLYHMRVATFWQARLAPRTDVIMASKVSHHPPPQTRWAITSPGTSADVFRFGRSSTPQPITWPHWAITSMTPMIRIEAMIERGTLRRGFSVSSASGTAASHPVRPCTVRTTARNTPEKVAMPPGLNDVVNGANENPPGPGLARPESPNARTMRNSAKPTTTIHLIETDTPV